MIDRPVVARIASAESGIFTQVAAVTTRGRGRPLATVLLHQFRPAVKNRVWRVVAEIEKKRLVMIAIYEFDSF